MASARSGRIRSLFVVGTIGIFGIVAGLFAGQALIDRPVGVTASPSVTESMRGSSSPSSSALPSESAAPTGTLPEQLRDASWIAALGDGYLAGILNGPALELPANEVALAGRAGLLLSATRGDKRSTVFIREIATGNVVSSFDVDFTVDRGRVGADAVFVSGHMADRDAGVWTASVDGGEARPLIEGDPSISNAGRPRILTSPSDEIVSSSLCLFEDCVTDVVTLIDGTQFQLEYPGGLYLLADEYVVLLEHQLLRAVAFDGLELWSIEFAGDIFGGLALDGSPSVVVTWQDSTDNEGAYHVVEIAPDGTVREIAALTGPHAALKLNGLLSVDGYGVLMPGYTMDEAVNAGFVRLLDLSTGSLIDGEIPVTK